MSILCKTESDGVVEMQRLRVIMATSYDFGSPGLQALHNMYTAGDVVRIIVKAGCRSRATSFSPDPANGLR
jgi:hypothetical protein